MASAQSQTLFRSLGLDHNITNTSLNAEIHSYTRGIHQDAPIVVLIHGYPQSAYIWRHVIPALPKDIPLFVPELPGYGISSPIKDRDANDKRSVGKCLLEALSKLIATNTQASATATVPPRKLILVGHDRGARIAHRLTVDFSHPVPNGTSAFQDLNLTLLGTTLLDILPTLRQWQAFSNPRIATGYFHWPLLAVPELAAELLSQYPGSRWAREAHTRLSGSNPLAFPRVSADDSLRVYEELFEKKETLYYSALDYAASANVETTQQEEDQKEGRKVGVPLLVMYSKANIGKTADVGEVWKDWIAEGVEYEGIGVGEGYGHYLPEEAHDIVTPKITEFIAKLT